MKRLISGLICCAAALPALAALAPGASAPDFSARASLAGKEFDFSLKEALKKGPVVVYFYPAAFTGGCNIQARMFATNIDAFKAAGASVIGVSLDKIATLNKFSADPEYCGGKVPVASDPSGAIAKQYELQLSEGRPGMKNTRGDEIGHDFAERTTFVVAADGTIAASISGVSPTENVEKALESVTQLSAGKRSQKKPAA